MMRSGVGEGGRNSRDRASCRQGRALLTRSIAGLVGGVVACTLAASVDPLPAAEQSLRTQGEGAAVRQLVVTVNNQHPAFLCQVGS